MTQSTNNKQENTVPAEAAETELVKLPYLEGAESEISKRVSPIRFAASLMQYDVISFDIFDTLLLRPFAKPHHLFMLVGSRLKKPEFLRIRKEAEKEARKQAMLQNGSREVTLDDIYTVIERRTGIPKEKGIQAEFETELRYCFANPYMKQVFRFLQERSKAIIIVSDMYIPHDMMTQLLQNAGYTGYDKLYVSCDYGCGKSSKSLYRYVKRDYAGKTIVHVGDNELSDIQCAQEAGLQTRYYANCHEIGNKFRADGMSDLAGSAYAGIVNTYLHNGTKQYSPHYEFGFIYGGLYILGYCNWMHQKAKKEGIDKILFLSRDGAIYQKVFNMLYDDVPNEYFLWSRIANLKYTLKKNREDFLKRMVFYRSQHEISWSVSTLLEALSLEDLFTYLPYYKLKSDTLITPEIVISLENLLVDHWDIVCSSFEKEKEQTHRYIAEKIGDAKKIAIVDVGWLGSGPMGLKYLIEDEFAMDCRVSCWLAAAKSPWRTDIMAELMNGTIETYMLSRTYNRNSFDELENMPGGIGHLIFEMFTQDTTPSYAGISADGEFCFDLPEVENYEQTRKIHEGIFDFCRVYHSMFRDDAFMENISGYDAFRPFSMIGRDMTFIKKHFSEFATARMVIGDAETQRQQTVGKFLQQTEE